MSFELAKRRRVGSDSAKLRSSVIATCDFYLLEVTLTYICQSFSLMLEFGLMFLQVACLWILEFGNLGLEKAIGI